MDINFSPLGINENERKELTIYPNPASNIITLQLPESSHETTTIGIYNTTGNLLYEMRTSENRMSLSVSGYPACMYIIKVTSENTVWSGKFYKM